MSGTTESMEKCLELAEFFLPAESQATKQRLAEMFIDTVDSFCAAEGIGVDDEDEEDENEEGETE